MPEENEVDSLTQLFTKIRRAEWAGQISECQNLIRQFAEIFPEYRQGNRLNNQEEPYNFSRFNPQTAIFSMIEEIEKRIVKSISDEEESKLTYLETQNLKATVFRVNEYDFALRGYLDNLDLEKDFYKKVREVSRRYDSQNENDNSLNSNENDEDDNGVFTPSWISFSEKFRIKTIVGDFSLFEIKGTWIDGEISNTPKSKLEEYLTSTFDEKLKEIEPQLAVLTKISNETTALR